jgi:tetratricopeptide (TPR) repeat protein
VADSASPKGLRQVTDWNRYREIDALRESGKPAEALVEFAALRESATNPEDRSSIFLGEALSYRDLGRFDKAAEAASEAVNLLPEESPSRPYAEFCLACAHGDRGLFELAAQELRAFLKKYTDLLSEDDQVQIKRDAQLRLIANLIAIGHAIEPLSIADALKKEDISPEKRAELSYREAVAHGLLGRHDHALKLYREAISGPLDPSLAPRAHFHVGEVFYDRGEFSQALDEFKIAENLADPGNPDKDHFARWVKHTLEAIGAN